MSERRDLSQIQIIAGDLSLDFLNTIHDRVEKENIHVNIWVPPTHPHLTDELLVVADVLARSLFSPVELSIGVITTIVGAPFFLWLLLHERGLLAR
mgnify:CR=1 FL=1